MFSFVVQKDLTGNNVIISWLFRLQKCRGWFGWNRGLGSSKRTASDSHTHQRII